MKLNLTKNLLMLGVLALTFTACKKDEEFKPSTTETVSIATENATAEDATTDAFNELNIAAKASNEVGLSIFSANRTAIEGAQTEETVTCYKWSVAKANTESGFPKTVTLDFGEGCTKENVTRKGKIIAVYSAPFYTAGATVEIKFENFSVNGIVVNGTKKVTNISEGNTIKFKVEVEKVRVRDEVEVSWSSTRTYELVINANNWIESYFKITGTASGVNRHGHEYTATITEPLIKYLFCPVVSKGKIEVKAGDKTAVIDFGTGVCDRIATVTTGGQTVEIRIKH